MPEQNPINSPDNTWDELKDRAGDLLDKIESGNFSDISSAITELHDARDKSIYRELGKLTRGFHDAIVNFDLDVVSDEREEKESKMANAQDRLDYVIRLTQKSADKTMDMVEAGIPIASEIGDKAKVLRDDWGRLIRRELNPADFRALYYRVDEFLEYSAASSVNLSEHLNEILLAQDFQDLTGQVIKKVISLVQDVEERLVGLMRVASQIEQLAGIVRGKDTGSNLNTPVGLDSIAEGPQVNAEQRIDVVSGQDDVDDLLSSLGF